MINLNELPQDLQIMLINCRYNDVRESIYKPDVIPDDDGWFVIDELNSCRNAKVHFKFNEKTYVANYIECGDYIRGDEIILVEEQFFDGFFNEIVLKIN